MKAFDLNFKWQEKFMPQVQSILMQNATTFLSVRVASIEEDTQQATDAVLHTSGGQSIALRIRRHPCKFRDLTVRSRSYNGGKTEIDKLREGWGDYYVYAWANGAEVISEWMLIDLQALRSSGLLDTPRSQVFNTDRRTAFYSYSIAELRRNRCIVSADIVIESYRYRITDASKSA